MPYNESSRYTGPLRLRDHRREGERRDRPGISGAAGGGPRRHGGHGGEAGGQDLQSAGL